MVSCKQCTTHNSLDSTFCKKCGATLADVDIAVAQEKLTAMIADGHKLFTDGRTEEAMIVAETAVRTNSLSAEALSLKGMCHERSGQFAEALECFERVIELKPDSMLDKIKVNDLRNLIVVKQLETPKPDRRTAVLAAVAASVLVVALGAVMAKSAMASSGSEKLVSNQPVLTTADPNVQGFGSTLNANADPKTTQQQQTQPNTNQPVNQPGTASESRPDTGGSLPRYNGGGALPNATGGASLDPSGTSIRPLVPNIQGEIGATRGGGGVPGGSNGVPPLPNPGPNQRPPEDPDPEGPKPPTNEGGEEKGDPEAPGIIEIKVSGKGKPSEAGTMSTSREGSLKQARDHYSRGEFQAAANTYERALRAGADPASTNQRLAQCYEKMGRTQDAIAAYGRAANAFESAIKSGRGDTSRANAAMEACRQAIKVLGG